MSIYENISEHLSKEFLDCLKDIPEAVGDMSENELKGLVKPTAVDYALKTSFWREVNKCEVTGGIVTLRDVYGGISTPQYFRNHMLKNYFRLAWMCRPTQVYEKEVEALLSRGTERLWELVEMDMYNEDGLIDPRRGSLVLETIKMIEQRAKGLAVARVQSVNVNIEQQRSIKATNDQDVDIDKRIRELEAQLTKQLPEPSQVIDVAVPAEERILEAVGGEEATS